MFGLTEVEMERYKELAHNFAVQDVTPMIMSKSIIAAPLKAGASKPSPDAEFVQHLVLDIETVITLTVFSMAYEYAYLQTTDMDELDIIKHLHHKYDGYLVMQFIKYCVAFTPEIIQEILGEIVLELPYLYSAAIEGDYFDEDAFLEEKLDAYSDYLAEYFSDVDAEEGEEEQGGN